jgi:hypothetical protein
MISTGSTIEGGSFDVNCPVSFSDGLETEESCGVQKTITWTSGGTKSNVTSYFFKYANLKNKKIAYVFLPIKIKKLFKFKFTPVTNNGSNITINIKQKINGIYTIVATENLGTLTSQTSKFITLYFDYNNIDDVSITLDIITSGGTSGQINCEIDCDPTLLTAEFCTGFTSPNYYCSTCPTTVTLYREKNPNLPSIEGIVDLNSGESDFAQYQEGPWYTDDSLTNEAPTGVTFTYALGDIDKRSTYTYNRTTHKFVFQSSCIGASVGCSDSSYTQTHYISGYTYTHQYIPILSPLASNGLKYSVQDRIFTLDSSYRIVPVTVTYTGTADDVCFSIGDGVNNNSSGNVSYTESFNRQQPYFIGFSNVTSIKIPKTSKTKTIYVVTNSGQVRVRIAVGQKKSYNGASINTSITVGCGNEIYGYDMGVHPYSPYDSYNNPTAVTKLWSYTPIANWSGSTNNYSTKGTNVYNDSLLTYLAIPYFYGDNIRTSPTNKVYQVGNILKREFGTHTDYKVKKKLFGPRKTSSVVSGPKDFTNLKNRGDETLIANELLVPTGVEPSMTGVGLVNKILSTSDYLQPSVYKYHLGYTSGYTETNANNPFFNAWNFSNENSTGITGVQHMMTKLNKGYILGSGVPELFKLLEDEVGVYVMLGTGVISAGFVVGFTLKLIETIGILSGGGSIMIAQVGASLFLPIVGLVIAIAFLVLSLIAAFTAQTKDFKEKFSYFFSRYATTPYITTGSTIYKNDVLSSWDRGIYNDGAYFYNIPSNSSDGKPTTKILSYTIKNNVIDYSLDVIDTSKTNYITETLKLFFLSYTAGYPVKYTTNPTTYLSNSSTITYTQGSSIVGELNNPLPIIYTIPEGFITSTISQNDADNQAAAYLSSLTGNTIDTLYSYEEKPGVTDIQLNFTHEIKTENTPNLTVINYDNSNGLGITIGKKLYYDVHGDSTALNGYYSLVGTSPFRTIYKMVNGIVTDVLIWQNSNDSTVTSATTGTHNIATTNLDYTSAWYIDSYDHSSLTLSLENNIDGLITNWNTNTFYTGATTGATINRGFVDNRTEPTKLYLYDNNLTGTTYTEAYDGKYREIFPFNSVPFNYNREVTLNINATEIKTDISGNNGVNFYITDSNANPVSSYVGVEFNVNLFQNGSLYTGLTISIDQNSSNYFEYLDIPSSGNTITGMTITSYLSANPFNNITFTQGTFTPSTGTSVCTYYNNTEFIANSTGYIEYMAWNATGDTKVYLEITSTGWNMLSTPYQYGTLMTSQSGVYTPYANITILDIGTCYTPVTPTPTPTLTSTVTPTISVTPTITLTPTISLTPTITPTISVTPTITDTPTQTPTQTQTPTPTLYGYFYTTNLNDVVVCFNGSSMTSVSFDSGNFCSANTIIAPVINSISSNTNFYVSSNGSYRQARTRSLNSSYADFISSCSACPTNTPTPTQTPTITPTISLTPTITPTPTTAPNYYYLTERYECQENGSCLYIEDLVITNNVALSIAPTQRYRLDPTSGYILRVMSETYAQEALITTMSGSGQITCSNLCTQPTPTPTVTPTTTVTPTISLTPTITVTPTITPTTTVTPTISLTPTNTVTPTKTPTPTPTLPALSVSVSSSNVQTCYGDSTASFVLSASGGNGASYEYSKDNSTWQASATFSSLAGNTYTGYVRNSNRTETVASVLVGNLAKTAVTHSITYSSFNGFNIDCNGGSNGTITVNSASGGTGTGYQTSINNVNYFSLPKSFTGLSATAYTIYTKDSNGCMTTSSPTLTQPTALSISISGTAPTCYNGSNGSVTASVTGGAGTYGYYLSTNGSGYAGPQASATFTGLSNGTYSILVVDGNSCTAFSSNSTLNKTAPNATITVTNVSCNGGADGSIAVSSGTGGSGASYSASTDNSTYFALPKTFYSLDSANSPYTIYIKDGAGCVQSYSTAVTQPTAQTCEISLAAYDDGTNIGQITASLGGGTGVKTVRLYLDTSAPYSDYSTDTLVATQTGVSNGGTHTFTGLSCNTSKYWVQVTDANGCVTQSSSSINVCSFISTNRPRFNTTANTASGGDLVVTYLRYDDYVNYAANGNEYSAGMILYSTIGGGQWGEGAGFIFDVGGSSCVTAISSGGLLSGAQTNCL